MRRLLSAFLLLSGAALAQPPGYGPGPTPVTGTPGNIASFGAGGVAGDSGTALGAVSASLFGTGADGSVAISSGVTTLQRDMHYANLTINGTGVIKTNGFRIYVTGTLDISAAQTGAISGSSVTGNSASGATGGGTPTVLVSNAATIPWTPLTLGTGGTGNTTTGTNPTQFNATVGVGVSGYAGAGGAGGNCTSAGASGLAGQAFNSAGFGVGSSPPYTYSGNGFPAGSFPVSLGLAGGPGGQGGGDGTNAGGGGGAPAGAPVGVYLFAKTIQRGTNVNVGVIQSIGGNGGNGGNAATGNACGGGGAGAASGGLVFVEAQNFLGSPITNGIDVSGGTGGTGGNGLGTGKGGTGGTGGGAGAIAVVNLSTPSVSSVQTFAVGAAATTATTTAGTAGSVGVTVQGNL